MQIADFSAEGLRSPEVLAVAQKVVPVTDASLDWKQELPLGRVEIVLHDGRRIVRVGDNVPGNPEAPLTWDDLSRKFVDCASAAVAPPAGERVEEVVRMARHLEELDDATELIRLLG